MLLTNTNSKSPFPSSLKLWTSTLRCRAADLPAVPTPSRRFQFPGAVDASNGVRLDRDSDGNGVDGSKRSTVNPTRTVRKWFMNGLESAGVVKDLSSSVLIIKEGGDYLQMHTLSWNW
ncbi:hypothetical protein HHK36_030918 [Tetracentron sinense]|uniref:Uncharacterized protein n=1 Tax=Tetracentron sinense TaxID=13715 RepID=A0A834YD07_TETSI|nr:hypothetical protein HHK36_030918 [Tetracentron sinense]